MTQQITSHQDEKEQGDVPAVFGAQPLQEIGLAERASALGVPYLEKAVPVAEDAKGIIEEEMAKKNLIAPFERIGNKVKIAVANPENYDTANLLSFIARNLNVQFETYLADEQTILGLIEGLGVGAETAVEKALVSMQSNEEESASFLSDDEQESSEEDKSVIQEAPVAKLLNVIIQHAIEGKASDIHIEPSEKRYHVRYRVDGILHSSLEFPKSVGRAVVSRIKILSNLKIDEKRKPQDGRFKVVEGAHSIDFRVSTLPVVDGEKVVMRLLDKGNKLSTLEEMGLFGRNSDIMLRNIKEPFGIILMTGPTGSGKSTTLYALLEILNQEERNIITLEDPVEYSIGGINQSQINPEIGYTFASGLRSILRQDPNVIMVGEIRDGETAELTIHAALTGHLVLSTLHTNSSIGAVPRLIDMGIESFLLASSLRVVAAQRLVRRICMECKHEVPLPKKIHDFFKEELAKIRPEDIANYGIDLEAGLHFYEGAGCQACQNKGYKGRIAIFEALEIDAQVKQVIVEKNGSEQDILEYSEKNGMITMQQDGLMKVLKGLTTLEEVERVTEGNLSIGGVVDDADE